jgi:hypothetical protein
MICKNMYLVISPWDLLLQRYNKLILENINANGFLYQQKYQQPNPLISLFLHFEIIKMR